MKKNKNSRVLLAIVMCMGFLLNKMHAQKTFDETLVIHLNAIMNSDLKTLEPTVSDSIIHISPMGEKNQSKAKFMKVHEDWFARTNWQWKGVILTKKSNSSLGYALIEYAYSEKDTTGNILFTIKAYLILIFKKSGKGWQLVHDQNTAIPS
jgi:ketosteroid isomerase-like protein